MKKLFHTPCFSWFVLVWTLVMLALNSCSSSNKNLVAAPSIDPRCVLNLKPAFERALYNTQVDILKTHLSGILFIKQMPDSSTRLVFSTETGFKFFDFAFSKEGAFTVHYILDKMNRKPVINTLEDDFSMLLMNRVDNKNGETFQKQGKLYHQFINSKHIHSYISDSLCSELTGAEKSSGHKVSSRLDYYKFSGKEPDSVFISHTGIKFTIALKRLEAVKNNN